jgi:HEAT repeat protein
MTPVGVALLIVFAIGAIVVAYAIFAPRRAAQKREPESVRSSLHAGSDWTHGAGAEFAALSEPARCDMIFAVAALDDDRSSELLERALDDPSEAVALAAAHALAGRGSSPVVERYLASHPGERADRIAGTLALLRSEGGA